MTFPRSIKQGQYKGIVNSCIAVLLACVLGGIILTLLGYDAPQAYGIVVSSTAKQFDSVLQRATPLMLSALAVAIPLKAGMFNLGGEGQLAAGAFVAAILGSRLSLMPGAYQIVCILAAMAVGFLMGLIPAWLKNKFGAQEIVVTLMLNYIIGYILEYLTLYPFNGDPTRPQTATIEEAAKIPKIAAGQQWSAALFFSIAMCFLVMFMMQRTNFGLELRSAGLNPSASNFLGINVQTMGLLGMAIGGAFAGAGGAVEVLASKYSYLHGYFDNYGFDGVVIAYMAGGNPIGIIFTSIVMAIIKIGTQSLERKMGISTYFNLLLQGIIIVFLVSPDCIDSITGAGKRLLCRRKRKEAVKS